MQEALVTMCTSFQEKLYWTLGNLLQGDSAANREYIKENKESTIRLSLYLTCCHISVTSSIMAHFFLTEHQELDSC